MKLKIGTARLQSLLAKAVKGASCNGKHPATSLITIEVKDNVLTLTTTDNVNYFTFKTDLEADDFCATVEVELFAKLISKMSCDEVTLETTENCLNVVGNGKYQIAMSVEDSGKVTKIPRPTVDRENKVGSVEPSVIANVLSSVKPALSTKLELLVFNQYYVKDSIMATDTDIASDYNKGFLEVPMLISPIVMDMLGLCSGTIDVYRDEEKVMFESENSTIYGIVPNGIESFAIKEIKELITQDFQYSCKIAKAQLLNALERVCLFVGEPDKESINLSFTEEGLDLGNELATETVGYEEDGGVGDFECRAIVNMLVKQVKAQRGDIVTIEYGKDNVIKFVDDDIVSVVALG